MELLQKRDADPFGTAHPREVPQRSTTNRRRTERRNRASDWRHDQHDPARPRARLVPAATLQRNASRSPSRRPRSPTGSASSEPRHRPPLPPSAEATGDLWANWVPTTGPRRVHLRNSPTPTRESGRSEPSSASTGPALGTAPQLAAALTTKTEDPQATRAPAEPPHSAGSADPVGVDAQAAGSVPATPCAELLSPPWLPPRSAMVEPAPAAQAAGGLHLTAANVHPADSHHVEPVLAKDELTDIDYDADDANTAAAPVPVMPTSPSHSQAPPTASSATAGPTIHAATPGPADSTGSVPRFGASSTTPSSGEAHGPPAPLAVAAPRLNLNGEVVPPPTEAPSFAGPGFFTAACPCPPSAEAKGPPVPPGGKWVQNPSTLAWSAPLAHSGAHQGPGPVRQTDLSRPHCDDPKATAFDKDIEFDKGGTLKSTEFGKGTEAPRAAAAAGTARAACPSGAYMPHRRAAAAATAGCRRAIAGLFSFSLPPPQRPPHRQLKLAWSVWPACHYRALPQGFGPPPSSKPLSRRRRWTPSVLQ